MNELDTLVSGMLENLDSWEELPIEVRRNAVIEFESRVMKLSDKLEFNPAPELVHHMGDNTYGREANVPKGVALVGMTYKEPQINVLLKGVVFVATENKAAILQAPCVFVSDTFTNKVGFVIEDMQWVTVMSRDNECVDPTAILNTHTTQTYGGD